MTVRIGVWCKGNRALGQDTWKLGEFEFPVVPRVGEHVTPADGWCSFDVREVDYELRADGEAIVDISIGWISPEEWADRLRETSHG